MKDENYTLIGALQRTNANLKDKIRMTEFLNIADNQEKFARAWLDGYKVEEKIFLLSLKILVMFMVILTMKEKQKFLN